MPGVVLTLTMMRWVVLMVFPEGYPPINVMLRNQAVQNGKISALAEMPGWGVPSILVSTLPPPITIETDLAEHSPGSSG